MRFTTRLFSQDALALSRYLHRIVFVAALGISMSAQAGLVGLYRFENSGNLGLDSSGLGNDLTDSFIPAQSTDSKVGAGALNSAGGSLQKSPTFASFPLGASPYTIAFWEKSSGSRQIIEMGSQSTDLWLAMNLGGGSSFGNQWWADDLSGNALTSLTDGSYHFIAATFDGTTRKLYADGSLRASDTPGVKATTNSTLFVTAGAQPGTALLDDLAVFNHALTPTELATISTGNFSAYVPEPSTFLLSAMGIATALIAAWKRRT